MIKKILRLNFVSLITMLLLIVCGTLTIYSAGHARELFFHGKWIDNLVTAIFGLIIYFTLAFIDYRKLFAWLSLPAYGISLLLLIAVLLFGAEIYGGKRWLWFFQPSESAKLCILIFFSQIFGHTAAPKWIFGFKGFLIAAVAFGFPALLILLEPDLGTTLTLAPAIVAILFSAKVWPRGLIVGLILTIVLSTAILSAVYEAEKPGVSVEKREKILSYLPLKDHQIRRIKTFVYPLSDRLGAGYNAYQAKIAIGSGGFGGKGFCKSETSRLKYLPPSVSMNDFIFCIYAEETGFFGVIILLTLFAALCLSGIWIAIKAKSLSGRLFALAFSTLLFSHIYINIGMSIGLVPITGLPLPFISSGRTFLIIVMAGLGILQSISIHIEERET